MFRFLFRRFRVPVLLFSAVMLYGVLGYTLLVDGADPIDALYWTTLTFGGVGFQDTYPLGDVAEMFSISLISGLVIAVAFVLGILTDLLASGDLATMHSDRRRRRMIERLTGHVVVCGFGRVGRAAVEELRESEMDVLVLEIDPSHKDELEHLGLPYIFDDPSHDSTLLRAGVDRAAALVCAVDNDAVNVFIALTARTLCPGLHIIARAADPESVRKLHRAGADEVVSPYIVSGHAMARKALMASSRPPTLEG